MCWAWRMQPCISEADSYWTRSVELRKNIYNQRKITVYSKSLKYRGSLMKRTEHPEILLFLKYTFKRIFFIYLSFSFTMWFWLCSCTRLCGGLCVSTTIMFIFMSSSSSFHFSPSISLYFFSEWVGETSISEVWNQFIIWELKSWWLQWCSWDGISMVYIS